jgi:hypothetical protein
MDDSHGNVEFIRVIAEPCLNLISEVVLVEVDGDVDSAVLHVEIERWAIVVSVHFFLGRIILVEGPDWLPNFTKFHIKSSVDQLLAVIR